MIFSDSIALTVIKKYGKGYKVQILTVFGPPYMLLLLEGSYETGLLSDLINNVFLSPKFGKYISSESQLFFQNVQNLSFISKMQQQIEEMFCLTQIISFELAVLNCLY